MSAAIKEAVWREVEALPQRSVIPDEVAQRWVEGIVALDPDRAVWHARRARGIGGSEVGEILRRHLGMNEQFKTPEQISREKLLLDLPQGDNPYIRRGRDLELLAQKVYERLTGRRSVKDNEPYASIFQREHPGASYAVGNPDDVNETSDGRVIIPDFKVRSSLDWSADVDLNYQAQCHWYGSIYSAAAADEPGAGAINHYCLAELDVPNNLLDGLLERLKNPDIDDDTRMAMVDRLASQICEWNIRGFGMRVTDFDHNQQLADDLMVAAEKLWNDYVLEGVPYYEPRQLEQPSKSVWDEAKRLMNELGDKRLVEKAAGERCTELSARLNELGRQYDLSGLEPDPENHAPVSVTQNQRFDAKAAAQHLIAQGISEDSLVKGGGGKLDPEKATQLLEANAIDPSPAMTREYDTNAVKAAIKQQEGVDLGDFQSPGMSASLSRKKAHEPAMADHQSKAQAHVLAYNRGVTPEPEDDPDEAPTSSLGMA